MATVLTTGDLDLPDQILDPWLGKVQFGSCVAQLSGATPMKFGTGQWMTFDIGEAEYVGEGANKGPSDITSTVKRVAPYKFHKTVRWTQEVMWADEDYQLGVVNEVLNQIQPALSRALDYGVFHGINPIDGEQVNAMAEYLSQTSNTVAQTDPVYGAIDEADLLVLADGYVPSGLALDPSFAGTFSTARTDDGIKLYPDLSLSTDVSQVENHRASVSNTVSAAGVAADPTGVGAFVGDFSAIRWGIQRSIGLEVIEYGDPDGQGDLKRNNQVAFRSEVVYGWGIATLDAFAMISAAAGS